MEKDIETPTDDDVLDYNPYENEDDSFEHVELPTTAAADGINDALEKESIASNTDVQTPEQNDENPATLQIDSSKNVSGSPVAAKRNKSLDSRSSSSPVTLTIHEPMSKITFNDTEVPIHDIAPRPSTSKSSQNEIKIPTGTSVPTIDYSKPNSCINDSKKKTFLELMKTFEGLLFAGEIIGSLMSWILLVVWSYADIVYRMPCPLGYSLFAYIASSVTTVVWFVTLLTELDEKCACMVVFREPPFGIAYNTVWSLAYLIAGGIAASYAVTDMTQVLAASTAFAFIVFLLHTAHVLIYFHRRFGMCPWNLLKGCNKECTASI